MSADDHLTSLPVELLHRIFDEFELYETVLSARLTCKLLSVIGAEHFPDTFPVFYERSSFDELEEIARHPLIGPRITQLVYHGDKLQPRTLAQWMDNEEIRRGRPIRLDQAQGEDFRCEYDEYRQLRERQLRLASSNAGLDTLVTLFRNCPKIDTVRLSYMEVGDGSRWETKYLRTFPDVAAQPMGDDNPFRAGQRDLDTICSAVVATDIELYRFSAVNLGCVTLSEGECDIELMRHAFGNLRSLALSYHLESSQATFEAEEMDPFDIARYGTEFFQRSALKTILKDMPELKILKLSFPVLETSYVEELAMVADLSAVIPAQIRLPKLRHVALAGLITQVATLVDFLLLHKERIRHISLSQMTLHQYDVQNWTAVFRQLAGQFPVLRKVSLDGWFYVLDSYENETDVQFFFGSREYNKGPDEAVSTVVQAYLRKGGAEPDWELLEDVGSGELRDIITPSDIHKAWDGDTDEYEAEHDEYDSDGSLIDLDDDDEI